MRWHAHHIYSMSGQVARDRKVNPYKMFFAGGFGGICSLTFGYPLDTIKVRLQTMPHPRPGEKPIYSGAYDCAAKTIKNEGFRGLYKGMLAPLMGVPPIFAICFFSYALGKRLQQTDDNLDLFYYQIFLAGTFSGFVSAFLIAPGERVKCLLQTQRALGGEKKYNGPKDAFFKLYKEGGLRSVYKGSCATMLRECPGNGVYFVVYEQLQSMMKRKTGSDTVSMASTLFAGGSAGVSYWMLGMPADVLKSRLQSAPEGTYKHGIRSVFKKLIATEGPAAFYRGIVPVLLRSFPANAICFFGIELAYKFFALVVPNF